MGSAVKISDDFIPVSTDEPFGLENGLAAYVRRRWPQNTVKNVMGHYGLSEGLARGVVYATGGLRGLNACIKKGGWPLLLFIGAAVLRCRIEAYINEERERERISWRDRDQRLGDMGRGLRALADLDCDGHG